MNELWIWGTTVKKTAPDGTEYSLLLLDNEGIDVHEQAVSIFFFLSFCFSYIHQIICRFYLILFRNFLCFIYIISFISNPKTLHEENLISS